MSVLLEAKNALTEFPGIAVVGPVSITVQSGDVCLITGPARSGKSVLLGMLADLFPLSAGSIVGPPHSAARIPRAFVPQTIALVDGLTIGENILLSSRLKLSPKPPQDWTNAVIGNLGLGHLMQRTLREASYGECHRVMLARSLCTQPSVLLVDEPFAHQDPEMFDSIIGLLGLHASAVDDTCCVVACRRYDSVVWGKPADVTLAV
jgi:ABC-type multidrug transport system ATPase subunit